jgi:hypothetical protein
MVQTIVSAILLTGVVAAAAGILMFAMGVS